MTLDDVAKSVLGLVILFISGVVTWLTKSVLSNREDIVALKQKVESLEGAVESSARDKLTVENVRTVLAEELEKRDNVMKERRSEWDRLHQLEIRQAVQQELEHMIPRIVREIRGDSGMHGIPKRPHGGSQT